MIHPFLERLARGPLLADGAMGTQLYARGIPYERCFDELNLTQPELVQAIHRDYVAAGAELIETNTFGANRIKLARFGLERKVRDINFRAVRIAREAREVSGVPVFLAGSVGPIGRPLAPVGDVTLEQAREAFREQIEALLEAGADLLVLETFPGLVELREAVLAAQSVTRDLPIVAQVSLTEDVRTLGGEGPEAVSSALRALGVPVIGVNCGVGPQVALDFVAAMARDGTVLSAQPNAGFPTRLEGRYLYFSTPEYFAEYARRFVQAGVSLIGGCCGTTPAHVAAMRRALDEALPESRVAFVPASPAPAPARAEPAEAAPAEGASAVWRKLAAGQFVVTVEVDPPRGLNPTKMLQGAALLKAAGADCVDVGDSPMARVRMSAISFAALVEQQVGLETIVHYTTRDRNLMALQSDLLGAHALGIRNVLAVTGDPPRMGNYPNATGVWDVDSIGLIQVLKRMNEGRDWLDNSIGRPTSFTIFCAVSPLAEDLERELDRFWRKVEAGAQAAITQPLYSLEQLIAFLERIGDPPIPLLLEVMPLQSYKHAEFLHNELPGVSIPAEVRERMRRAGERGIEEGLAIARELMEAARPYVQGFALVPSFHRYEVVAELVREIVGREALIG